MAGALLELSDIGKTYPGVTALEGVDLAIDSGEVLGLIGENGAGKSTLMKILGGVIAPSQGGIRLDERDHAALTIADAMGGGIAFVHQELNLFDNLDVAANIFIGREPLLGRLAAAGRSPGAAGAGAADPRPAGRGFRRRHAGGRTVAGADAAGGDRQGAVARMRAWSSWTSRPRA